MLGNARLLQSTLDRKSADLQLVAEIVAATDRMSALTRQLDAFGGAARPPRLVRLELCEGVAACAGILRALLGSRIRVEWDLGHVPLHVRFDPVHLSQVIINLASNARDAMEGRGSLRISAWKRDAEACLAVTDSGPGVPADVMERVFDPYVTTKPASVGTGLGLATVSSLVRQAGGGVTVENIPAAGARFCVSLPPDSGI